ncbi:hypothetical protein L9F63_016868, partial [Diploptera punctata]
YTVVDRCYVARKNHFFLKEEVNNVRRGKIVDGRRISMNPMRWQHWYAAGNGLF